MVESNIHGFRAKVELRSACLYMELNTHTLTYGDILVHMETWLYRTKGSVRSLECNSVTLNVQDAKHLACYSVCIHMVIQT